MVRTRSNKVDSSGVGPLCFDPTDVPVSKDMWARSPIAWDYFSELTAKWPSWSKFLLSKPDFEAGAETEWVPLHPLGKGSSGEVALWAKLDQLGDVKDRIVIKHQSVAPDGGYRPLYDVGLAKEAVYQAHLSAMSQSKENITQLRAYRFYPDPLNTSIYRDHARLYLRFAPHGTLEDVWSRYRARKTYLPEQFLWSVLKDLANTAVLLQECPTTWNPIPRKGEVTRDWEKSPETFILHQDIKFINYFINDARGQVKNLPRSPYHSVELGDYGVATARQRHSRRGNWGAGTPGWRAPEEISWGRCWAQPPFYWTHDNPEFYTTSNLWGVGKTMWHLMTLKGDTEFPALLECLRPRQPKNQDHFDEMFFYANGRHILAREEMNRDGEVDQYSEALRDAVYECLRPDPAQRPDPTELLRIARRGLKNSLRHGPAPVAFSNNEMNDLDHAPDAPIELRYSNAWDRNIWHDYVQGRALNNPEGAFLWTAPGREWQEFADKWGRIQDRYDTVNFSVQHQRLAAKKVLSEHRVGKHAERKDVTYMMHLKNPNVKRALDWVPEDEGEENMRRLLRDLRARTQPYAAETSMGILVHILESEKFDVDAAEKVLKWLYEPRSYLRFAWAQNPTNRQQATVAQRKWRAKQLYAPRSFRECLYFVSKEAPGVLRISMAIKKMETVFAVTAEMEQEEENVPHEDVAEGLTASERLQRLREIIVGCHVLFEKGEIADPDLDENDLTQFLVDNGWDVQKALDKVVETEPERIEAKRRHRERHRRDYGDDGVNGGGADDASSPVRAQRNRELWERRLGGYGHWENVGRLYERRAGEYKHKLWDSAEPRRSDDLVARLEPETYGRFRRRDGEPDADDRGDDPFATRRQEWLAGFQKPETDDYVVRHAPEIYGRSGQGAFAEDDHYQRDRAVARRREDIDALRRGKGRYARYVPAPSGDSTGWSIDERQEPSAESQRSREDSGQSNHNSVLSSVHGGDGDLDVDEGLEDLPDFDSDMADPERRELQRELDELNQLEMSSPVQRRNREQLEAQLAGVPVGTRRNSSTNLVTARNYNSNGQGSTRADWRREPPEEVFMSGLLAAADAPNAHLRDGDQAERDSERREMFDERWGRQRRGGASANVEATAAGEAARLLALTDGLEEQSEQQDGETKNVDGEEKEDDNKGEGEEEMEDMEDVITAVLAATAPARASALSGASAFHTTSTQELPWEVQAQLEREAVSRRAEESANRINLDEEEDEGAP